MEDSFKNQVVFWNFLENESGTEGGEREEETRNVNFIIFKDATSAFFYLNISRTWAKFVFSQPIHILSPTGNIEKH